MLRQLARLTRPVPAVGPTALAVAVYADGNDEAVAARESGFEGVACIDDAARLLGVLCRVWSRAPLQPIEAWAHGLLEFVLWMQASDGRWVNFVYDWDGGRNEEGLTSEVGENFWHGRALSSLVRAWLTFGDPRAEAAIDRGLAYISAAGAPSDVRALHLEAGIGLLVGGDRPDLEPAVRRWA
ncbi:MAG TPA: hypothetical protein VF382_08115, partial [Actinomycetota bacterium]